MTRQDASPAGSGSADAAAFLADPAAGRIFTTSRSVRSTDVTAAGRLRLDAIARYLQEAAEDDVLDAGWDDAQDWLLRRCVLTMRGYPGRGERVGLRTFCSGLGPRWAERTTTSRSFPAASPGSSRAAPPVSWKSG